MNFATSSTESSWLFSWSTPAGHRRELRYIVAREAWDVVTRVCDPVTGELGAWSPPLPVDLPRADDHDHAKQLAEQHAGSAP